jgi:hypothetical protein
METLGAFVYAPAPALKNLDEVNNCLISSNTSNITISIESVKPFAVELTLQHLPSSVVNLISYIYITTSGIVVSNVAEAFLYLSIFHNMKRY